MSATTRQVIDRPARGVGRFPASAVTAVAGHQPTQRGHDGVAAVIEGTREMFPGHLFRLVGGVDAHHDVARFGWELVPHGGGGSLVIGFDVAVRAPDGRLAAVHGFLDKVPAA